MMVFIAQLDKRRQTERETEDGQERGDDTMLSHISDMISGGEDEDDQHNDSDPVCLLSRWSYMGVASRSFGYLPTFKVFELNLNKREVESISE